MGPISPGGTITLIPAEHNCPTRRELSLHEYLHVFSVVTVHGLNDTVRLPTPSGAPGPRVILRLVADDSSRTSSPVENVSRSGNFVRILLQKLYGDFKGGLF